VRTALALAPIAVVLVVFELYCVISLLRSEVRVLPKWVWLAIIFASVPLGGVVFLVAGRGGATGSAPGVDTAPVVPAPTDVIDRRPTSPTAVIETTNLTKHFGPTAALEAVDLRVPAGSVFGLVGPNGAGKTTMLSILAGLRPADDGGYSFGPGSPRVALLPDTPQFEPWLTAREVVELARALAAPDTRPERTDECLAMAGLLEAADRPSGGFSRGMLQRLGLAATIVGDPDVLLLDEPCSALDPSGRREVLDLVGQLAGRHTVLFCSHILDDVQEVCDAVGILRSGHLLYQGPLAELLTGQASPAYTIRVRGPAAPLVDVLTSTSWVHHVEQVGAEVLEVAATSLDDAERGLAPALAAAGVPIVSVVPSGANLENVFLELTR